MSTYYSELRTSTSLLVACIIYKLKCYAILRASGDLVSILFVRLPPHLPFNWHSEFPQIIVFLQLQVEVIRVVSTSIILGFTWSTLTVLYLSLLSHTSVQTTWTLKTPSIMIILPFIFIFLVIFFTFQSGSQAQHDVSLYYIQNHSASLVNAFIAWPHVTYIFFQVASLAVRRSSWNPSPQLAPT